MALDVALLDSRGRPGAGIQICVEPHVRLMALVDELKLPILHRMEDYYKDADFAANELGELLEEVLIVLGESRGDAELVEFLSGLQRLAATAIDDGVGLAVIAD